MEILAFLILISPFLFRFHDMAEEAGIQEISPRQKLTRKKETPHIFHHSHVVNALMAGVPVPMIQKQVGHKRLSTTETYATVADGAGKKRL